jgi:hypothetical protein
LLTANKTNFGLERLSFSHDVLTSELLGFEYLTACAGETETDTAKDDKIIVPINFLKITFIFILHLFNSK